MDGSFIPSGNLSGVVDADAGVMIWLFLTLNLASPLKTFAN